MSREQLNPYLPDRHKRWGGAEVNASDPLSNAKAQSDMADDALRKVTSLIDFHLAGLLGDWVHGTFGRLLEAISEQHGETVWHYAEALAEADSARQAALIDVNECRNALLMVAQRIQAHYAKAQHPLPIELEQVVVIAAAKVGYGHLFPPGDERHVHDRDVDGKCRNPLCRSDVAKYEEEPF